MSIYEKFEHSTKSVFFTQDSYKLAMHKMYPPDTTEVYSFIESRGGIFDEIVAIGVRHFVLKFLDKQITENEYNELVAFFKLRPEGFDESKLRYIIDRHNGYLPLHIKALPEGTIVPTGVPFVIVYNTDPEAYWLTTVIETVLLSYVWSCVSVATLAREMKKLIKKWNDETSPGFEGLNYQLHNFGDRGAKPGFAQYSGIGHMTQFGGNDCIIATKYVYDVYADKDKVYGLSIPASEHSISTAWGPEREKEYVLNMIDSFKDGPWPGISIVADTYNVYEFTRMIVTDKDIRSRLAELAANGKKVVLRPDSGAPEEVLIKMLDIISEEMSYSLNAANYKVLPPGLGIIWGDGVCLESINTIFNSLKNHGWASQNIVLGCGGYLVDSMMRDSLKFAMKASNVIIADIELPIGKNPITASWKKSKKGKFAVIMKDGKITWKNYEPGDECLLETVYINGYVPPAESFQNVIDRSAI